MWSGLGAAEGQKPLSERVLNYDEFEFNATFNSLTRNICLYSGCNNQEQQEQQHTMLKEAGPALYHTGKWSAQAEHVDLPCIVLCLIQVGELHASF